jgi:carbonic anhydrase
MKKRILMLCFSSALLITANGLMASGSEQPMAAKGHQEQVVVKGEVEKKETHTALHWSYSGENGPSNWGKLSPNFTVCETGRNQSPIDVKGSINADLPPIKFKYTMMSPTDILNNGHTVQVDLWSGGEIIVDGLTFTLKQFHFHTPSENTIKGKRFPFEMHLVHLNDKNEIAVVAIMFEVGKEDALLAELWKSMPLNAGDKHKLEARALRGMEFESGLTNYYRFNGSLTTPPCSEGVRWIVMKATRQLSQAQLLSFKNVLSGANNRPVQALNARVVVE